MIDWKHVTTLKEDVGAEDFDDVVALFFAEVEETLSGLARDQDSQAIAEQIHFLKGAALNLGFSTLAERCRTMEKAVAQNGIEPARMAEIAELYSRSKTALLHGLA